MAFKPHGSQGTFDLVTATRGGTTLAKNSIGAGLQQGALLINVKNPALSAPIRFTIGLWDGKDMHGALPRSGRLLWSGSGAPHLAAGSVSSTTSTASPAPLPATTPPLADLVSLVGQCSAFPSGTVPAWLEIRSVKGGSGQDPRTHQTTPLAAVTMAGAFPAAEGRHAFSVTVAVLPAGQTSPLAPGGSTRPIDGSGLSQLYIYWDGQRLHKGIRTRTAASGWSMLQDSEAGALTIVVQGNVASVYWTGFHLGDHIVAVTASSGGCRASGLTP